MIDRDGFRANVGIILSNDARQLFWAKRIGQTSWQFPQGGVRQGESLETAMYRELYEETGLQTHHVDILAMTNDWLRYRLPERYIRHDTTPLCLGQKQKWFLLKLTASETCIDLNIGSDAAPEFDDWRWVNYWAPLKNVIDFKRDVYHQALTEMESTLFERNSDDVLLRG